MSVRIALSTVCLLAALGSATAQPPAPAQPRVTPRPEAQRPAPAQPREAPSPAAQQPASPPAPRRDAQPINVKVDVTITDQRGGAAPIKRTVSVVVADGYSGMIRSQSEVMQVGPVPLNIDVDPMLLDNGKVRVKINLQYDWPAPIDTPGAPPARGTVIKTGLHDTVVLILENGKPMIAAQSADPIGDRQVAVEVKATILK
jgi:hypothetical protein